MKIHATTTKRSGNCFRRVFTITIDKNTVFSVWDGEPEDNTLGRNFNDCFKVTELMKLAWLAGKTGQSFDLTTKDETEND